MSISVQSLSDIITNSSSEVFLVAKESFSPPTGSESWFVEIDFDFLCHDCNREFVYEYLEIPDILEGYYPDPKRPSAYYNDRDPYSEKNQYYIDLLKEYIKGNQDKFDKVLGGYLVFVSDHDPDTYEGDITFYRLSSLAYVGHY
jgi:hypothetical protein